MKSSLARRFSTWNELRKYSMAESYDYTTREQITKKDRKGEPTGAFTLALGRNPDFGAQLRDQRRTT